mmetsp:Transcript_142048/g.441701  ORF Transcript_142048/g.441701 Transcript_142048/m.441701 type:complete len:262 (-) Transcript_142048:601-1386(-)
MRSRPSSLRRGRSSQRRRHAQFVRAPSPSAVSRRRGTRPIAAPPAPTGRGTGIAASARRSPSGTHKHMRRHQRIRPLSPKPRKSDHGRRQPKSGHVPGRSAASRRRGTRPIVAPPAPPARGTGSGASARRSPRRTVGCAWRSPRVRVPSPKLRRSNRRRRPQKSAHAPGRGVASRRHGTRPTAVLPAPPAGGTGSAASARRSPSMMVRRARRRRRLRPPSPKRRMCSGRNTPRRPAMGPPSPRASSPFMWSWKTAGVCSSS